MNNRLSLVERYFILHNQLVTSQFKEQFFRLFDDDAEVIFENLTYPDLKGIDEVRDVFTNNPPFGEMELFSVFDSKDYAEASYALKIDRDEVIGTITIYDNDQGLITKLIIKRNLP